MTLLWVAALCVVAAMFFSAVEMAFIAANRVRLRYLAEGGHRIAARYLETFRHPERVLSTAMMGVTIAHVVAASAATWGLAQPLGVWAPFVVTAALTPVMLVFGEIIPKAIAREWATPLILRLFRPLTWAGVALAPFVGIAHTVVSAALRLVGVGQRDVRQFVSREELKALLHATPEEADVTTQEAEMIDKIFDLGATTVRAVMVPLVETVMLPETASVDEAIGTIRQHGFSRLPVYRERETSVVGIVTAMDLLSRGAEAARVEALLRPPYYVPETKRLDDLLREMQRAHAQLAVVVDEYGGSTGIVTLEDILEEIVGEIQDEHDRTPASVERLADGSYWIAGRTSLDEINDALGWVLPRRDVDTVAGLVLASLGRIPRIGEVVAVPGYVLTVVEADARHVGAVRITPARAGTPEPVTRSARVKQGGP